MNSAQRLKIKQKKQKKVQREEKALALKAEERESKVKKAKLFLLVEEGYVEGQDDFQKTLGSSEEQCKGNIVAVALVDITHKQKRHIKRVKTIEEDFLNLGGEMLKYNMIELLAMNMVLSYFPSLYETKFKQWIVKKTMMKIQKTDRIAIINRRVHIIDYLLFTRQIEWLDIGLFE